MTVNSDNAFDVDDNGVLLRDSDGNVLLYLTCGSGDPDGTPAPVNTWYFDQVEQKLYRKNGAGDNDWDEFVAAVAASIEAESYSEPAQENTTSNDWVTKFEGTTQTKVAGDYLFLSSAQLANSDNNKDAGYRFQWKLSSSGTWNTAFEIVKEFAKGESFEVFTVATRITIATNSSVDFRFQFGETDGGGTARLKETNLTIFGVTTPL